MASILGRIFKRKPKSPISITTKKEKAAAPIKITVPKQAAPAMKIHIPKTEAKPAIGIKLPEERHEPPKIDLPAHHIPDAEALSQIVAEKPQQKPAAKAAPEPVATIDQVVASLPKKGAVTRSSAIKTAPKKAGRKTKHDKMIASIASRSAQARPARKTKQSKR